jgi:hypothetical protein
MADEDVDDHIDVDIGAWNKMCSTITQVRENIGPIL